MIRLLYYILVWPSAILLRSLIMDDLMLMLGFKMRVPTGRPVWRFTMRRKAGR